MAPDVPPSSTGKSRAEKNAARRKRKKAQAASMHASNGGASSTPSQHQHTSRELADDGASTKGKSKHGSGKRRRLAAPVSSAEGTAPAPASARGHDDANTTPQRQQQQQQEQQQHQQKKNKKNKKNKNKRSLPPPLADTVGAVEQTHADDEVAGGGSPTSRVLDTILERARAKHRQDIGKGRPLVGWDIAALGSFVFRELAAAKRCSAEEDEEGGNDLAVAGAVEAVTAAAEQEHAGQVSMAQFEVLVRVEAAGFWTRRRAASLLQRALGEEQAGNLDAAEAGCAACLAAWPGCASGHLKMAKILRARGLSQQRAVKDVEFHLRRALGSASKAGAGEEGLEVAQAAAEGLSLLLCQEGRDKEAAKVLKRRGFRYRLAAGVLRYPLSRARPPPSSLAAVPAAGAADGRSEPAKRRNLAKGPASASSSAAGGGAGAGVEGTVRGGGAGGRLLATTAPGENDDGGGGGGGASEFVAAFDAALPEEMLSHLQEAFGSRSRFWSEHGYNSETGTPGYFSYIHALGKQPTTSIEQVINRVRTLAERSFPEVKEAKFVEWWAHRRPHSSGHQMHFDSDNEGRGGVRNPIVSVVVYVTGDVGGPTLVTTQRLTSKRLADRGWVVHPRVNRVCMFDGGVLHGVIPGRGVPPAAAGGSGSTGEIQDQRRTDATDPGLDDEVSGDRDDGDDYRRPGGEEKKENQEERAGMRVTWMVAFWRDIQARPRPRPPAPTPVATAGKKKKKRRLEEAVGRGGGGGESSSGRQRQPPPPSGAGAAQPFPAMPAPSECRRGATTGLPSWPALFRKKPKGWGDGGDVAGGGGGGGGAREVPVRPVAIPQVWEDVDAADNRRAGAGVGRLKRLPEYELCFQGF